MRYHRLDLNLILVLDALLALESVSRVAEQLCLTPSSISNALSRLRAHFEDELFVVVGRRMVPTPFARSLREPAAAMLRGARAIAVSRARFDPRTSTRTFQVTASDYVAKVLLAEVAREIERKASGIGMSWIPLSDASIAQFHQGALDILIAPDDVVGRGDRSCPLFGDRFVPVVWRDAEGYDDRLSEDAYFEGRHVVAEPADDGRRGKLESFFASRARPRRVAIHVPSFLAVPHFLVGTRWLGTVPRLLTRHPTADTALRILDAEFDLPEISQRLHWPIYLDADPALVWWRDLAVSVAAGLEADLQSPSRDPSTASNTRL